MLFLGIDQHARQITISLRDEDGDVWRASVKPSGVVITGGSAASDRVALGRCRPRAPTDPYVRALAHTVPLIMVSRRAGDSNGRCEREQAGNGDG